MRLLRAFGPFVLALGLASAASAAGKGAAPLDERAFNLRGEVSGKAQSATLVADDVIQAMAGRGETGTVTLDEARRHFAALDEARGELKPLAKLDPECTKIEAAAAKTKDDDASIRAGAMCSEEVMLLSIAEQRIGEAERAVLYARERAFAKTPGGKQEVADLAKRRKEADALAKAGAERAKKWEPRNATWSAAFKQLTEGGDE